MSQVKKLETGSTVDKKLGSLTINGVKYDATPEMLQALSQHLGVYGESAAPLSGVMSALQNGEDLVYEGVGNTITGNLDPYSGVSDRMNEKRKVGASNWRKNWQATFNTDAHQFRKALHYLNGFSGAPAGSDTDASKLTDILGDRRWFNYDPDSKAYLESGEDNLAIDKRLADWTAFLGMDEDAAKKAYNVSAYGDPKVAGIRQLYAQNKDKWDTVLGQIKERAKAGTLTAEDKAFLKNFNIYEDEAKSAEDAEKKKADAANAAEKLKWENAGFGDLWDSLGGIAHINKDGSISVNDGETWALGSLNGNIFFNDDFYTQPYAATGEFDPYRNYTLLDGKLYTLNNPYLAAYLNADSGFNAKMKSGDWDAANSIIQFRFSDRAKANPVKLGDDFYSTYLSGKNNIRYSNITGLATTNGMEDGDQLIQYVDLNDNNLNGPYRQYKYKYAILDNRGNLKKDGLTNDDVQEIQNGESKGDLLTYRRIHGTGTPYDNYYYEDLTKSNGDPTGFRIFRSTKDPNGYILKLPQGLRNGIFGTNRKHQNLRIPAGLARVLINNKQWQDKIFESAQNQKDFENIVSALIQRKGIRFGLESSLRKLGFSDSDIAEFKNALQGSMADRRYNYLVDDIELQKSGGILKHQFGGFANGNTSALGVTEKRTTGKTPNPQNAAAIGKANGQWTDADSADIAALVADLGSLGLALAPDSATDIASVITGMTGSTARFYADSQRGTKGRGWNYLANLGMDAVGLIPIIGGPIKSAGIVSKVRKTLPTILKAAAVFGVGDTAINSIKKIANGEDWTIRDLDMAVNALTGIAALHRQGGFGRKTKNQKITEDVTVKGKQLEGDLDLSGKQFKFTEEELTPLLNKSAEEQKTALNDLLLKKVRQATGNESITMEQALRAIDDTNLNVESLISNPIVGKKSTVHSIDEITLKGKELEEIVAKPKDQQESALDELLIKRVREKTGNPNLSKEQALGMVDKSQFTKEVRNLHIGKGFGKKQSQVSIKLTQKNNPQAVESSGNAFIDWWRGVGEYRNPITGKSQSRQEYIESLYNGQPRQREATVTREYGRYYEPKIISFQGKKYEFTPQEVEQIAKRHGDIKGLFKSKLGKDAENLWDELYRAFLQVKNPTSVKAITNGELSSWRKRTSDVREVFPKKGLGIGVGPRYRRTRTYIVGEDGIARPSVILPLQLLGNEPEQPGGFVPQPSYKKGGIIKDQSPAGPLTFDPNWKPKLDVDLGPGIAINGTGNGVTQKYMDLYGNITERPQYTGYAPSVTTTTAATPTTTPATTSSTSTEDSGDGSGNGKNTYGPWEGKAFQFDPTVPLNWLRAGVSMGLSDKQFRRFRDRPRLRLINPNLNAPRYINNGEGDAYRTAANTTRMFKPTSSNALTNDIGLRQRQQQATQYDLQGSLADSKNYGAYKQGLDAFNNEQFLRNLDFANKKRELDWKHDIETIQAANANTSQKSKFFDQAAYSTQDWITQQMQKSNMYRYMKESNPERLAIMDTYQKEYNAAMKLTGDAQTEALRNAKWKAEQALEQLKLKSYGVGLYAPFTHFVKSGGKISKDSGSKNARVTYSRDPYPDLLLQNSKAVDKFIEQLSDHTIKLILDSKPLYVS